MSVKARISKLENMAALRVSDMAWRKFISCDDPNELPPELREAWAARMEMQDRGISTLASALTDITGQDCTPQEAGDYLANLSKKE